MYKRILSLRKEKGWTQEELAERAHISRQTVGRAEKSINISLETLTAIANALGVSCSFLYPDNASGGGDLSPEQTEYLTDVCVGSAAGM